MAHRHNRAIIGISGPIPQMSDPRCPCGGTECSGITTTCIDSLEALKGIVASRATGSEGALVFALVRPAQKGMSKFLGSVAKELCGKTAGHKVHLVYCIRRDHGCCFNPLLGSDDHKVGIVPFLRETCQSIPCCGKAVPQAPEGVAAWIVEQCEAYVKRQKRDAAWGLNLAQAALI